MSKKLKRSEFVDPEWERWQRQYPRFPGVQTCVELLRAHNVRGTWLDIICSELSEHAAETLNEMISAFRSEPNRWIRVNLLWAIADAKVPEAVPFLIECLLSEDEGIRSYAEAGLRAMGTKEARTALWEAEHPCRMY